MDASLSLFSRSNPSRFKREYWSSELLQRDSLNLDDDPVLRFEEYQSAFFFNRTSLGHPFNFVFRTPKAGSHGKIIKQMKHSEKSVLESLKGQKTIKG